MLQLKIMIVDDPEFSKMSASFFQLKVKKVIKNRRSGGSESLANIKANVHRYLDGP